MGGLVLNSYFKAAALEETSVIREGLSFVELNKFLPQTRALPVPSPGIASTP